MSFYNYVNESASKQFLALSKEIDNCTKQSHSKLVKELDIAFKDKIISAKEYSELDDKLFDKFKSLNNKLSEDADDIDSETQTIKPTT